MARGFVYVITVPGRAVTKVGITRNDPARRLAQLQTGSPDALRLYAYRYVPGYVRIETEAHRRLAAKRARRGGEWFDVRPADALAVVDAIIAEGRRPIYRELRSLWDGLAALATGATVGLVVWLVVSLVRNLAGG